MIVDFIELQNLTFSKLEERIENMATPAVIIDESFKLIYKNSVFSSYFPNIHRGMSFESQIDPDFRKDLEKLTDSEIYWREMKRDSAFRDAIFLRFRDKYVVMSESMKNGRDAYLPVSQNTMGILPQKQNHPRSGAFISMVTANIARELRSNRVFDVFQPSAIIKNIIENIQTHHIPQERIEFFDYSAETSTTGSQREFAFLICNILAFCLEKENSVVKITLKNSRGTISLSIEANGGFSKKHENNKDGSKTKYSDLYTAILAADNNLWDIETENLENGFKITVYMTEIPVQGNFVLKENLKAFIAMLGKLLFQKS